MLIDSQKVIDIIERHQSYGINGILENIVEDIDNFCSDLENMGLNINKEQEPKTGHWIEHDWEDMREKGYYRCSVCGTGYQRFKKGTRKSDVPYIDGQEYTLHNIDNYCPNCGARMVESQESEVRND